MELQIFTNAEFGTIRAVLIKDIPYFGGKDVAIALGYEDTKKAMAEFFGEKAQEEFLAKNDCYKSDFWDIKKIPECEQPLINECAVRILIANSNLSTNKKKDFTYWIILQVLCSLFNGDVNLFAQYCIQNIEAAIRLCHDAQDYKEYLKSPQYKEKQSKEWADVLARKLAESRAAALANPILSCVYVLEMSNGTIKIGYTRDFEKRMQNISGGSGLEITRHYKTDFIDSEIAYSIEQKCHAFFDSWRIKGEFFDIGFEEACAKLKELFEEK